MSRWRQILHRFGPRPDADKSFYADRVDAESPVLIHTMGPMAAGYVAARVLRAIAARRGTVVRNAALEKLENLIARGIPTEVIHHCETEAERILEWIDTAPASTAAEPNGVSPTPELDMMMAADVESRLSVAQLALDKGYDVELEYYDQDSRTWPRLRATPVAIHDSEAADFQTCIEVQDRDREIRVPIKYVRWLMPVSADPEESGESAGADVLDFPGSFDES